MGNRLRGELGGKELESKHITDAKYLQGMHKAHKGNVLMFTTMSQGYKNRPHWPQIQAIKAYVDAPLDSSPEASPEASLEDSPSCGLPEASPSSGLLKALTSSSTGPRTSTASLAAASDES